MSEISTCAASLLHPGTCCTDACVERATLAVLDADLVEHTRCHQHGATAHNVKALAWDPDWAPPGRHTHAFTREVDGETQHAVLDVQPSGVVILSEELVAQLMADAGWERAE